MNLKVPKLRHQTFETAIIERYRRRDSSVEEALIEMYLAGISVRQVQDITEALWGTRVSRYHLRSGRFPAGAAIVILHQGSRTEWAAVEKLRRPHANIGWNRSGGGGRWRKVLPCQ